MGGRANRREGGISRQLPAPGGNWLGVPRGILFESRWLHAPEQLAGPPRASCDLDVILLEDVAGSISWGFLGASVVSEIAVS